MDIEISLGQVDLDSLRTEEDIRAAARGLVPDFLRKAGEAAAKAMWETMQKSPKGPGFGANNSASEKRKFIAEAGREYARKATAASKREIEDHIAKEIRSKKGL